MRWLGLILILWAELTPKFIMAQQKTSEESTFSNEFSGGFLLHPRGLGVNFRNSKKFNETTWRTFEVDLMNMKHPKEFKIRSTSFQNTPGSYTFGKLNYLYFIHTGFGVRKELASKLYKNTISTTLQLSGGPVFSLLKPVYLEIYYPYDNSSGYLMSERYDPAVHTRQEDIFGASKFSKGLGEMSARVGLYTRVAANFDWSDFNDQLQAVELGVMTDIFPQRLPVMAFTQNKFLYTSVYICVNFGSRW